jgi:hypothetical protein
MIILKRKKKGSMQLLYNLPIACLGVYSKDIETYVHPKSSMRMFMGTLFVVDQNSGEELNVFKWRMLTRAVMHPHHGIPLSDKKAKC